MTQETAKQEDTLLKPQKVLEEKHFFQDESGGRKEGKEE